MVMKDHISVKHSTTRHEMTCGLVSVQGWPLIQVKITKTGLPRAPPPNRGGRLIQVRNTAFV